MRIPKRKRKRKRRSERKERSDEKMKQKMRVTEKKTVMAAALLLLPARSQVLEKAEWFSLHV